MPVVPRSADFLVARCEGEQMVNRIPNCYVLTNKLGLLTSLQRYEQVLIALRLSRVVKLRMSDFVPETYRLDDSFQQRAFFEAFARALFNYCHV